MKTEKNEKNSSLFSTSEEMTRHMKEIFEDRDDPDWKLRQQVKKNREELMDKSELGI